MNGWTFKLLAVVVVVANASAELLEEADGRLFWPCAALSSRLLFRLIMCNRRLLSRSRSRSRSFGWKCRRQLLVVAVAVGSFVQRPANFVRGSSATSRRWALSPKSITILLEGWSERTNGRTAERAGERASELGLQRRKNFLLPENTRTRDNGRNGSRR